MHKHIIIVGAGVIGLTTAYALIQSGHQVTLIEASSEVGSQTSFANGGQLSYRYVSPLPDSGIPLQGIRWMGKIDSPLNLKVKASVSQWDWLLKFTLACNKRTNKKNGDHLLRLSLLSQQIMDQWRTSGNLEDFGWSKNGKLIIYRDIDSFKSAASKTDPNHQQILDPKAVTDLEPSLLSLEKDLCGGIFTPNDESADCHLFCQSLLHHLEKNDRFSLKLNTKAMSLLALNRKVKGVSTDHGEILADDVVICSGNQSNPLLSPLKITNPIIGLKGYSLTLAFPEMANAAPKISVTDYNNKIVYAKLNHTLRIAAMVDIGYDDIEIRSERINALKKIVARTFPLLDLDIYSHEWSGLRPSTPKGPPIIGACGYENLWLNIGHGSLGFTLAAGSAALIDNLISQTHPPISLEGLTRKTS